MPRGTRARTRHDTSVTTCKFQALFVWRGRCATLAQLTRSYVGAAPGHLTISAYDPGPGASPLQGVMHAPASGSR